MKHTPGPWAFTEGDAERRANSEVYKLGDKAFRIAEVNCEWLNKKQRAEDLANLRLIAAAPELLAALQLVLKRWTFNDNQQHTHNWHDWADCTVDVRRAIEKATSVLP